MKQFQRLPLAVCLVALALPQVSVGQLVELVANNAVYDYLLTIKDINGTGLAVDPTADLNFAVVDVNNPISNVAIWPFAEYDVTQPVSGVVRDTGNPEILEWKQAPGPFIYGGVGGITGGTDLLAAGLAGAFAENDLDGQKLSQYFRTNFTTTDSFETIFLDVLIDDAAVFYIDGFEVARYNCCDGGPQSPAEAGGAGAPAFDAVANGDGDVGNEDIRNNNWDPPFTAGTPNLVDLSFLGGSLEPGEHVFGVTVLSYGDFSSSDLGMDVRLYSALGENQYDGLSGSWANGASWSLFPPNGVDAKANLLQLPTASTTIYHNGGVTLGELSIDNANKYAIAGLGTFTFETTGADALIDVASGDHEFQAPVALMNNTNVNVAAGASLEFNNDLRLNGNNLVLSGAGTVSLNNALFTDGGAVNAAAGAVLGGGTVYGDLVNSGATLSPGNRVGVLTVEGDFSQGPEGTIEIELADALNYDQLLVGGELEFGGTLVVSLLEDFEPQLGDEFTLFQFASAQGTFRDIQWEGEFELNFDYATGNLAVVPESTGVMTLLLAGLGCCGLVRRRRS